MQGSSIQGPVQLSLKGGGNAYDRNFDVERLKKYQSPYILTNLSNCRSRKLKNRLLKSIAQCRRTSKVSDVTIFKFLDRQLLKLVSTYGDCYFLGRSPSEFRS